MTASAPAPAPDPDGSGVASDPWQVLRGATRARVALGRAGDGLPTARWLEFRAAHTAARDAVHTPVDPALLRACLGDRELLEVHSAAPALWHNPGGNARPE